MIADSSADLSHLAPQFTTSYKTKLYAAGSSSPLTSGSTYFDFSNGPVQFTTSSEDGTNAKNYWVQVVKADNSANGLYVNSFADERSKTKTENGITYSNREILLDDYHDAVHDILLVNMGSTLSNLSVELDSAVMELDRYWTLTGDSALAGISDSDITTAVGSSSKYLKNLAKIRLKLKDDWASEISGTLTIKSGSNVLAVLTLSGIVGAPTIVTQQIPQAVKYVPYGSMIQNNNSYRWNQPTYSLVSGKLPVGMTLKENGEIYGVPKESGSFTFKVKMVNSYSGFGSTSVSFTMTVAENTDANVENATDTGYTLTQRVENVNESSSGTQLLVSQGEFVTFEDIYLDGEKLILGTDYEAEAGSTRITIQNQTLNRVSGGIHTLGIEFREGKILKRAAQNYINQTKEYLAGNASGNGSSSTTVENGSSPSENTNALSGKGKVINSKLSDPSLDWSDISKLTEELGAYEETDEKFNIRNINVIMNGNIVVSSSILKAIKNKPVTIAFHVGNGVALSISGENLKNTNVEQIEGLDLTTDSNSKRIADYLVGTQDVLSLKKTQFSIKDTGEYPVIVNVHIALGTECAGKMANLYRKNAESGMLEYCGSYRITSTGQAMFALQRGGDYLVTVTHAGITEDALILERQYVVRLGDSMYLIAKRNHMSLEELLRKNPQVEDPYFIKPGQIIHL